MDKNNEGPLTKAQIVVENSFALTRALRPELFDKQGKPIPHRFRQALPASSPRHIETNQENVHG